VQALLALCDGRRRRRKRKRKRRRTCENKKYVRVQTHKYTMYYTILSSYLSICFFLKHV
jgi:hypothetical protein